MVVLILLLLTGGLAAQPLIDDSIFPQIGDTLIAAVDAFPGELAVGPAGGPQTWDFRALNQNRIVRRPIDNADLLPGADQFPDARVVIPLTENADGYYRLTDDRLELIGYFGEDPVELGLMGSVPIQPAYVDRRAPLAFGSTFQTTSSLVFPAAASDLAEVLLDSITIPFDSLRLRVRTEREDEVNAFGVLQLSSGTFDVLRERRTELRDLRIDAKLGFLPWVDVTDLVQELLPASDLGRDTVVSYYFWANDHRQPVAVVNTRPNVGVTSVEYKISELPSSVEAVPLAQQIRVYPNPGRSRIRVQVPGKSAAEATYRVVNAAGQVICQPLPIKVDLETVELDLTTLPRGTYHLMIYSDQGRLFAPQVIYLH